MTRWPLWAGYALLSLYFTGPMLASGDAVGIGDWDAQLFHHGSVLKSVIAYGQFPFWNPWYCGGSVLWQNPQVSLVTPVYLIAPLAGLAFGMKLNVLLHYLVGFAGMHVLLTRILRIDCWPWLLFLGALFIFAGGAAMHLADGHITFLTYFYLPWVFYFFFSAIISGWWIHVVAAGAVVALGVWNGGIHLTFMASVAIAILATAAAASLRSWRPIVMLVASGFFALLFAAPKLLPAVLFTAHPGTTDIRYFPPNPDRMSLDMLARSLFDPFQYRRMMFPGQNYGWHEYGNYIGFLGAALTLAALVWVVLARPWRREYWLGVAAAVATVALFVLAMGDFGPYAPYAVLRKLPMLSQFRLPSRYLLVWTFVAACLVAWTVRSAGAERPSAPGARRLLTICLLLAVLFLAQRNRITFQGAFPFEAVEMPLGWLTRPPAPRIDPDTDGFGPEAPMLHALAENRSLLRCNEPLYPSGDVDPGRPILAAQGGASLSDVAFGPSRIRFRVVAGPTGGRVYLNQRYTPGWRTDVGEFQVDPGNHLGFIELSETTAGAYEIWFLPPGFVAGGILLMFGVTLAVLVRSRRIPAFGDDAALPLGESSTR